MNIDTKAHERSGRTTRMLEHAVKTAREGMQVVVFGANDTHARSLKSLTCRFLENDADTKNRLIFRSFSELTTGNIGPALGRYFNYDYRAGKVLRLRGPDDGVSPLTILIDHMALESHLADVLRYLRTAGEIKDHLRWMIDTARMMSTMGRRTYIVTEDSDTTLIARIETRGYNVSVEDGSMMANLNLLNQELVGSHLNAVLLIDPQMLYSHFYGALREMGRWNK